MSDMDLNIILAALFAMRPLSISFYRYAVYHQMMGAILAHELIDEDDGYPWDLY